MAARLNREGPIMNQKLADAFRYHRQRMPFAKASYCLQLARKDVAGNVTRYSFSRIGGLRGGKDWQIGSTTVFWSERPADYLRHVGFADDVDSRWIRHKGWYTSDDNHTGELARGVVFQMPARHGVARYIAAVADPCNDGPAVLCVTETYDDKAEAARAADSLAEVYAEKERDYERVWQAGERFRNLADEIAQERQEALALLAERRDLRATVPAGQFPNACAALISSIKGHLRAIKKARRERARLFSDYGMLPAFSDE
jgi:hypothetical protein